MTPLLSICFAGRNDNYTPDFLYRMATTINFAAKAVNEINSLNKLEIIVTDWGSDKKLSTSLSLSEEGASITKFVYVSKVVANKVSPNNSSFDSTKSFNCSLRHASGTYLALCGADIIIPANSFASLFNIFEKKIDLLFDPEKTYFNCGRHVIPWNFISQRPSIRDWKRYLAINSWAISYEPHTQAPGFLQGGSGILMFHKNSLNQIDGISENIQGWGWSDIDLSIRHMMNNAWIDLKSHGVIFYDMEHAPLKGSRAKLIKNPPAFNINSKTKVNNNDWGLKPFSLEYEKASPKHLNCNNVQVEEFKIDLDNYELKKYLRDFIYDLNYQHFYVQDLDEQETLTLLLVNRFMNNSQINNYLDFGVKNLYSILVAAYNKNDLEMYGIDFWEGVDNRTGPHVISRILNSPLINCKGYARFINGEKSTALERLSSSFIGECKFSLAVLRESFLQNLTMKILEETLVLLEKNGVLIFIGESEENTELARNIASQNEEYNFLENSSLKVIIFVKNAHITGSIDLPPPFLPSEVSKVYEKHQEKLREEARSEAVSKSRKKIQKKRKKAQKKQEKALKEKLRTENEKLKVLLGKLDILSQSSGRTVFFGAGKHCQYLISILKQNNRSLPDIILDDSATSCGNLTVAQPNFHNYQENDIFVMATDSLQEVFRKRINELFPNSQIIDLYT